MNFHFAKSAALIAAAALTLGLSACGGDDDAPVASAPPPVIAPAVASVSGTAAMGNPIPNGTVSMQCVTGDVLTGTTSVSGTFTVKLSGGQTFPCFITVTGGSPAVTLHTVAQAEGNVNVTLVTELIIAAAAGTDPAAWFASGKANLATALATLIAKLPAAQTAVVATLKGSGYTVPPGNLLTVAFTATNGDPYDDLLEALKLSLDNAGTSFTTFVASTGASGTTTQVIPFTHVIKPAEVAAMPMLNSSSLTINGTVMSMTTGTSTAPVGSYVGGGNANKVVFQIDSFDGMKLSDFLTAEIEFRSDGYTTFDDGPYLNLLVDLDCVKNEDTAPTATLADLRAGRKVLVMNFYRMASDLAGAGITTTSDGFSKYSVDRSTAIWNVAGADSVGLVSNPGRPSRALTAFDSTTYPNACIINGRSGDGGLFRDKTAAPACDTTAGLASSAPAICAKPHAGVLLNAGGSTNTQAYDMRIRNLKINKRTYTFSQ